MQHWEKQMVQQTFVPCFPTDAAFQRQRVDYTDVKDNISKCQHMPFTSFENSESMEWEMTRANMAQKKNIDASGSFDAHASSDDLTAAQKPAFLRLPELVDLLAKEGQVLRWNELCSWYEVLDGPLFEEKFNALRCTRGKRKEQAVDRPFARMHNYFILVRGGRWAGTGSTFRPIGRNDVRSPCSGLYPQDKAHVPVPTVGASPFSDASALPGGFGGGGRGEMTAVNLVPPGPFYGAQSGAGRLPAEAAAASSPLGGGGADGRRR
eukprot:CAMPEP_0172203624 /NCGR_PEP_ID=MMETSP1050-20130122/31400_1 /TAXON_ID=233186 /ORGANISM="Cryptomonas curvata, Strain CCAP979/52" /LENGTH=264 /DNA_ID=CAMNT_0012881885 /DNA_START=83 /DNA_END=873 /DNA_ORIENTATION=+